MNYADHVRGALTAVSVCSRRTMDLHELALPEDEESVILHNVDQARELLLNVADRLKVHGMLGYGNGLGTISAAEQKRQRQDRLMAQAEKPWKSVKERVADMKKAAPKDVESDTERSTFDVAHPWRTK